MTNLSEVGQLNEMGGVGERRGAMILERNEDKGLLANIWTMCTQVYFYVQRHVRTCLYAHT